MKIIRGTKRLHSRHEGCIATIGNFDGLHEGHRSIIQQVKNLSLDLGCPSTVISFEPLPTEYFGHKFSKPVPGRIYPFRDKARLLKKLGIDEFVCLRFDDALSEMEAEAFITEILIDHLNVKYLVVGDDFRFGKQRKGDFQMLFEMGKQLGMKVSDTITVEHKDERISSTRIRDNLVVGNISEANKLLAEPYQLSGRVRHGDKRGRTIGYPTLNQFLPENMVAARGVYAVRVRGLSDEPVNGVANLGSRPTVGGDEIRLETHLFDFNQQVYGKYACVEFVEYLRPEKKFDGLDALVAQINKDSEKARELFAGMN